jgi:nitrogen regulatory protein PII
MKTVEIIIENKYLEDVLEVLEESGVLHTTSLKSKQDKVESFKNICLKKSIYLSTICSEEQKSKIVKRIFPLIMLVGGICIA